MRRGQGPSGVLRTPELPRGRRKSEGPRGGMGRLRPRSAGSGRGARTGWERGRELGSGCSRPDAHPGSSRLLLRVPSQRRWRRLGRAGAARPVSGQWTNGHRVARSRLRAGLATPGLAGRLREVSASLRLWLRFLGRCRGSTPCSEPGLLGAGERSGAPRVGAGAGCVQERCCGGKGILTVENGV